MTVRWRARWTMSSTQAVPRRLEAALSPAVGPTMWMQVGRPKPSIRLFLCLAEGPYQFRHAFYMSFMWEGIIVICYLEPENTSVISYLFLSNWIEMVLKPQLTFLRHPILITNSPLAIMSSYHKHHRLHFSITASATNTAPIMHSRPVYEQRQVSAGNHTTYYPKHTHKHIFLEHLLIMSTYRLVVTAEV